MRSDLAFSLVVGVLLMLLVVLSRRLCRGGKTTLAATKPPRAKRVPKPFAGLTRKPECPLCELEAGVQPSASAPHAPPPRMLFTRGRRRHVDTSGHFCPQATCAYHGRVGWGNIRANGHPNGRRWRQLVCLSWALSSCCPSPPAYDTIPATIPPRRPSQPEERQPP
jgi:hypothetical protein